MISPAIAQELRSTDATELVANAASLCAERFAAPDAIPVVIAARNEEADLPATLISLAMSDQPVRPYVVENGSNDRTAEYAIKMGAVTLHSDIAQKMASLQLGVDTVLEDQAGSTILFTDADTLVGPRWAGLLAKRAQSPAAADQVPVVACGLGILAYGSTRTVNTLRNARMFIKDTKFAITGKDTIPHGYNMAVTFDPDGKMHHEYSAIAPNTFIGEERAICDAARNVGGVVLSSYRLGTTVLPLGDRYTSLSALLKELGGRSEGAQLYAEYEDFVEYHREEPLKAS